MQLKAYAMKKVALVVAGIALALPMTAVAQEVRSEVNVQGAGFITKDSNQSGIQNHATDTGGVLVGYRHNINRWLAAEANYGWARNTQNYLGSFPASIRSDVHQISGSAVVKLPMIARLQPGCNRSLRAVEALWSSILQEPMAICWAP